MFWHVFFKDGSEVEASSFCDGNLGLGVNPTSPQKMVLFDGFVLQGLFFNHKLYLGNQPVPKKLPSAYPGLFRVNKSQLERANVLRKGKR